MSVRFPSDVLEQFAANVELISTATTASGRFTRSKYRELPQDEPDSVMPGRYFLALQRLLDRKPNWGNGENIQHGTVTVWTSYARAGGDMGGGDRQTVMRNALDDCQLLGDVCENPANYNAQVTGIRTVACQGSVKVHDLPRAEVYETTFDVTWRTDLSTTPVIATSEGGGVTLLPIYGEYPSEGVAAQEDVVSQVLPVDFDDFSFETVKVRLLGFVKTSGGTATFRVRLGGTRGAADGTVVASMTTTSASYDLATGVGAAFAIPSGVQILQVTLACNAAAVCAIDGAGVAVLDGAA